jgi:hypothetical protein
MPPRFKTTEDSEHPPAMSGTPTAWRTLVLLALAVACWLFFKPVFCTALRGGLALAAWGYGGELHIDQLVLTDDGWIQARGITWLLGPHDQRSSVKSAGIAVRLVSMQQLLHSAKGGQQRLVGEMMVGKTKVLLDTRANTRPTKPLTNRSVRRMLSFVRPSLFLPSASCTMESTDLVMIGDHHRLAVNGLTLRLPDRWAGRISYADGVVDVGNWHGILPKASAPASWEGGILHLGMLDLGHELILKEASLRPTPGGMDFGMQGTVGHGLLRGDGTLGMPLNPNHLELTLVGEGLALEAFREWMKDEKKATGVISQARFTFRGDPSDPVNADSSLRLIARDFHWEGKGWESLRLAATLTGRNLVLSELLLQQKENEVTASGQSHLPADWHAALRSPFTGKFHAELEDASALAGLAGPEFAQLGGGLLLEGEIHGAENKAEGYCNLTGTDLTIRKLPLDWLKGCIIFAGDQTRLTSLEAWSGRDHLNLSGQIANSRPHAYKAEAQGDVRDLTKRLAQLGVMTASVIGGGGVKFRWQGEGSAEVHTGSFQTQINGWVSKWTTTGMSGTFEGTYAPGKVVLTKANFRQDDLTLGLKLSATPAAFSATEIVAKRAEKQMPLVKGDLLLPFNAPEFWQSGDALKTIAMDGPVDINLFLQGIKAEEIAGLLGQQIPFVGTLEGSIAAKGTPAKPEFHAEMSIRNFSPKQGGPTADLSVSLAAGEGKARAKLLQEPASASPLSVELEVPLRLVNDRGTIRMGDNDQPISGFATFQHVPLDGWVSMARLDSWPLKKSLMDGKIRLSGSWQQPVLEGTLLLEAEKGELFSTYTLESLSLPITLSSTKAVLGPGSAVYRSKPLTLSGELAWEKSPLKGGLHLQGNDLPLTLGGGLNALANIDLVLGTMAAQAPVLSGSLQLHGLTGALVADLTPAFAPPAGLLFSPSGESSQGQARNTGLKDLVVDLSLRTEGLVMLAPQTNTAIALDMKAVGSALAPSLSGTIQGKNMEFALPCGTFFAPQVRMVLEGERSLLSGDYAYGLTQQGFSVLSMEGALPNPKIAFEGEPGISAPNLLMSMATGRGEHWRSLLQQGASWCRQNQLFPLPATKWMTARQGDYEPAGLGFYGAPWIWNLSWGGKAR